MFYVFFFAKKRKQNYFCTYLLPNSPLLSLTPTTLLHFLALSLSTNPISPFQSELVKLKLIPYYMTANLQSRSSLFGTHIEN